MKEKNQKIVCITGMERSGTSMIARILNIMGVYFGPEEKLIMETEYNVKGCWEHRGLLDISGEILRRFGGDTHVLPDFHPGWENDPSLSDLEEQARSIINDEFSGKTIWGWKDTRCCLTLPFWQKILPDMNYIICIRNPLDVAKSLVSRDWVPTHLIAHTVWLKYNVSVLRHTHRKRRIFMFYEDFFKDWRAEVERLTEFLGKSRVKGLSEIETGIEAFIERGLKHYDTGLMDSLCDTEMPLSVKALYFWLVEYARDEDRHLFKKADITASEVIGALALSTVKEAPQINKLYKKLEFNKKKIVELNLRLAETQAQLEEKERLLKAMLDSYSWKITAPLRRLFAKMRGTE